MQPPAADPAANVSLMSYLLASEQLLLALIALYVYFAFFLGVLARKTSTKAPSWLAWIPIANLYLMSRVARQSIVMAVLMLVPLVNLAVAGMLWKGIAIARGKPGWTGWLILVPGLNLLLPIYLAAGEVTDPEAQAAAAEAAVSGVERAQFCPECGAALEAEQQFCGECGFDVSTMPPSEADADAQPPAATAPAAGPPKLVMRSPAAIAGILAALVVVGLASYVLYDSFTSPERRRELPALPTAMVGTMTEFPIDSTEMHPVQPDAIVTQQLGSTPLRVPAGWLPPGVKPETITRNARAVTAATYRAHETDPPVSVTVLNTNGPPRDTARQIAREAAQAAGATEAPIQVKSPTGQIYDGSRIKTDKQATYVLARADAPSVVVVHTSEPAAIPVAERLAANVGNGAGLTAFPAAVEMLSALPTKMPANLELQEARTVTAQELSAVGSQVTDASQSLGPDAQRMASQVLPILPQQLVMARYQDAAKQDWGVVRGQYRLFTPGVARLDTAAQPDDDDQNRDAARAGRRSAHRRPRSEAARDFADCRVTHHALRAAGGNAGHVAATCRRNAMRRALALCLAIFTASCGGRSDPPPAPRAPAGALTDVSGTPAAATPPAEPPVTEPHAPAPLPPSAPPAKESPKSIAPIPANPPSNPAPAKTEASVRRELPVEKPGPAPPERERPRPPADEPPRPPQPVAPPVKPGYTGPSTGTIRWSGVIETDGTITIEGNQASTGFVIGTLPGVPVLIQVFSKDMVVAEPPGAASGWKRITLRSRARQTSLLLQWTVLP